MLVANKFQTGFDQPKLCAMYVDKKLGGVDCVQTLSRLNRTYEGKEKTFILDFVNDIEDIKEAFEPYYTTSEIDDITDPNIVYDIQTTLESNGIFTDLDVEQYAQAFFNPKGTQSQMSSALKPSIDCYKGEYKEILVSIQNIKEILSNAIEDNDEKTVHNLKIDLEEANKTKSALEIFKANMVKFVRMYEFLSQIVDYDDEELEKLCAFNKGLIPNLKTVNTSDDVDITLVELTRYQLHKQKEQSITLEGGEELKGITAVGSATPKDPEKVFLTQVVEAMNTLFGGNFTDDDVLNYARTISDKVKEDTVVIEQISNNTKEQAMLGGFAERLNDAVIDSLDIHQNMATQVLSEDRIRRGLANIVYDYVIKGINTQELKSL